MTKVFAWARGVVVVLPGKRQRRSVDGVDKLSLVALVACDIDRAAHEEQERNSRSAEEDEDVTPLVAPATGAQHRKESGT